MKFRSIKDQIISSLITFWGLIKSLRIHSWVNILIEKSIKFLPENTDGILYINVLTVLIGTPFKGSCILLMIA